MIFQIDVLWLWPRSCQHATPTSRSKIVSCSRPSVARIGGGCTWLVSTTVFSASNSKPICSKCITNESVNCTSSWRERAKIRMSFAKRQWSKVGAPCIKSMPACLMACLDFRAQIPRQHKITADSVRRLVTAPVTCDGEWVQSHEKFHRVVQSAAVIRCKSSLEISWGISCSRKLSITSASVLDHARSNAFGKSKSIIDPVGFA